jgi:hypothetical protein
MSSRLMLRESTRSYRFVSKKHTKHATTVAVTLTAAAVLSHHTPVAVRVAVTAAAVSRFAWTAEPSMAPLLCVNTY